MPLVRDNFILHLILCQLQFPDIPSSILDLVSVSQNTITSSEPIPAGQPPRKGQELISSDEPPDGSNILTKTLAAIEAFQEKKAHNSKRNKQQ